MLAFNNELKRNQIVFHDFLEVFDMSLKLNLFRHEFLFAKFILMLKTEQYLNLDTNW